MIGPVPVLVAPLRAMGQDPSEGTDECGIRSMEEIPLGWVLSTSVTGPAFR